MMDENLTIQILLAVVIAVCLGCDNTLQPLDKEKGHYSIYGDLYLDKEVNYIRIRNLNIPLSEDSAGGINAEVLLKDISNGISETLKDTIVEFDGVKTHNFRTTMDIQPGAEYQVLVKRSNEELTSATATAPFIADTDLVPDTPNCTTQVKLSLDPVSSKKSLQLSIGVSYDHQLFWYHPVNDQLEMSDGELSLSFTPLDILNALFSDNFFSSDVVCSDLGDDQYFVRYTIFGPDYFANTISDSLNIPGGAGTFGALYEDSFSFAIDTTFIFDL